MKNTNKDFEGSRKTDLAVPEVPAAMLTPLLGNVLLTTTISTLLGSAKTEIIAKLMTIQDLIDNIRRVKGLAKGLKGGVGKKGSLPNRIANRLKELAKKELEELQREIDEELGTDEQAQELADEAREKLANETKGIPE